ncbi:MAG: S-methyl-5'-thioadenosine phosphorylase [Nitrospirae bacterium]|nr:MAG: S-methyl-5'-thioadenosine phosphorylase [Nitrospirota bacterium]
MARGQAQAEIGIIGGSGLYDLQGLERVREVRPSTPFGQPSDALVLGTVDGVRVAFLARHGRGHRIGPSEINYRANIYALKSVGVTRVVSVSAVGSMKETVRPGEVVLPDQFVDLTKRRIGTFFEQGIVAHVAFAEPICHALATSLYKAAQDVGASVHQRGVYICIEGPQFSSRGESNIYRQWGVDVIGMTNLPEAKLAREAELCYVTLALVTDYDCWHDTEAAVTVEAVLATLHKNVELAKRLLRAAMPLVTGPRSCGCGRALEHAILTSPQQIPKGTRKRLHLLLGRYLSPMKGAR